MCIFFFFPSSINSLTAVNFFFFFFEAPRLFGTKIEALGLTLQLCRNFFWWRRDKRLKISFAASSCIYMHMGVIK